MLVCSNKSKDDTTSDTLFYNFLVFFLQTLQEFIKGIVKANLNGIEKEKIFIKANEVVFSFNEVRGKSSEVSVYCLAGENDKRDVLDVIIFSKVVILAIEIESVFFKDEVESLIEVENKEGNDNNLFFLGIFYVGHNKEVKDTLPEKVVTNEI